MNKPTVSITIHVPATEVSAIEVFAAERGMSRAAVFKVAVREYIATKKVAQEHLEVNNLQASSDPAA